MNSTTALRLFDTVSRQHVIVQGDNVYAERDGKISKADELRANDPRRQALIDAAHYINDILDPSVPRSVNADGTIVSGAMLNQVELKEFEGGGTGAVRPPFEQHLAIFDRGNRGKFSLVENYHGWRLIPPYSQSAPKALKQALASGFVFNFLRFKNQGWGAVGALLGALGTGGTVDIRKTYQGRPSGSTRIYDKEGMIDEGRWAELKAHFLDVADENGLMKQSDAKKVVEKLVKLGLVPRRQFDSLWEVAAAMNQSETVTIDQIRWLYDGSLLHRAAAMTDNEGHSPLGNAARKAASAGA
jgi:hypothetical protein